MNADEILNSIVEEVLKRLERRMKKATVLFTGGAIGSQEALQQLKLLIKNGWDLNILLSNSAGYVLTPQLIKSILGINSVFVEHEVKELRPFWEGISTLIFPTLTLNTAVKISLGIQDNMATNIASHVIMKGIPIIAAKDACDLQNPIRKELGLDKSPMAYLEKMNGHLQALESYGVKLVYTENLYKTVQANTLTFTRPTTMREVEEKNEKTVDVRKKVLTRIDVVEAKQNNSSLRVPRTTIVSPLALEIAKNLGVKIIQE